MSLYTSPVELETVFEDDELLLRQARGTGKRMVVSFAGAQQRNFRDFTGAGQGKSGAGKDEFVSTASGGGDNYAVFVTDKRRSWYSRPGLFDKIVTEVKRLADASGVEDIVTIGNSMGGFGAMAFADALGARVAIAFAPQASMDPSVIEEKRWSKFRAEMDPNNYITISSAEDSKCLRFVVCGVRIPKDIRHANLIGKATGAHVFRIVGTGHAVAIHLKQAGILADLVGHMMEGRVKAVHRLIRPHTMAYAKATAATGAKI